MSAEVQEKIWVLFEDGGSWHSISEQAGQPESTVRRFVVSNNSRRPIEPPVWSNKRMSLTDREEISRGIIAGDTLTAIAGQICRAVSTVSREVARNGGRDGYRAADGEASVRERAKRPRPTKIETSTGLRARVEYGLSEFWSPEQIAADLKMNHPTDASMRLSHESIYRAIYAGEVSKTVARKCLRSKRTRRIRRTKRRYKGVGEIKNQVRINKRPPHVEDRDEAGHWEGDLIVGTKSTALATLVERKTRYTLLVRLDGRSKAALNEALIPVFETLPDPMVRSLTWDQGKEISGHEELTEVTGIPVYLCFPHCPWQRGTNENTNGLLRQWWPRSTHFFNLNPSEIERVAASLNNRPRRTLGWTTPATAFATEAA